jgi:hypothetical protein
MSAWVDSTGTQTLTIEQSQLRDVATDQVVGYVHDASAGSAATSIGKVLSPQPTSAGFVPLLLANLAEVGGSRWGYVPIVGDESGPFANRVVGFGLGVDFQLDPTGDDRFQLTKRPNSIAAENASALLLIPTDDVIDADLFAAGTGLGEHALFAPVLVR